MKSRIEDLAPKKLIGMRMEMSFANNKTYELWKTFMPRRGDVENRSTSEYISMQVYDKNHAPVFSATEVFEKWATVEVDHHNSIPEGMEGYILNGGKYAVFIHVGPANKFPETMQYIFGVWLPDSKFKLDKREHFEILKEGYNPHDPNATEEVWVPITNKTHKT